MLATPRVSQRALRIGPGSAMDSSRSATRERVVAAASKLFLDEGYGATGMDAIGSSGKRDRAGSKAFSLGISRTRSAAACSTSTIPPASPRVSSGRSPVSISSRCWPGLAISPRRRRSAATWTRSSGSSWPRGDERADPPQTRCSTLEPVMPRSPIVATSRRNPSAPEDQTAEDEHAVRAESGASIPSAVCGGPGGALGSPARARLPSPNAA